MSSVRAWWRWRWAQLRGRSPLVRGTDRVEVAALIVALVISAAAAGVGAALGAGVHESRMAEHRAQVAHWHEIPATVVGTSPVRARSSTTLARTVWRTGVEEHSGTVVYARPVRVGDTITVWVDERRSEIVTPTSAWQVSADALAAALAVWLAGTCAAAAMFVTARLMLRRRRFRDWERAGRRLRAPTV